MIVRLTIVSLVALAISLAAAPVLAQEVSKAEVETYLDKIAKTHGRLNECGKKFGSALAPAMKGGEKEQLALYRAFREMGQLIWQIRIETREFAVPDHPAALEVKAANTSFLTYQVEVVLDKIPGLLEIVDDANLTLEEKQDKVLAKITKDNDREVALGKTLREKMAALREAAK